MLTQFASLAKIHVIKRVFKYGTWVVNNQRMKLVLVFSTVGQVTTVSVGHA